MSKEWFKEHRKGEELSTENFLRDLKGVKDSPKKEIEKVMDFLFKIGYFIEVE